MDPQLIDADDKHRAAPVPLRSPDFRRMLRLAWPHRRFIAWGLLASIVYGFLHSVSIIGMLPVLKVMLSEEGFHGWVYRSVAAERLDLTLAVRGEGEATVVITGISADSPLGQHGTALFDLIDAYHIDDAPLRDTASASQVQLDRQQLVPLGSEPFAFFEAVATADARAQVILTTRRPGAEGEVSSPASLVLAQPSFIWSAARWAADLLPVPQQRSDRVTTLIWILSAVVAVALLSNVARFVSQYYVALGVLRAVMDLRRALYRKVLRLPMDFFSRDVSDTVSRFVQDAQEIQRGLMAVFGKMLREPIKAVFVLGVALQLNARMTLMMLVVGPLVVLIFWAVGRKIRKANKRLLQTYGLMIGALSTTLHAIGIVKAYNAENTERKHLWRIDRKMFTHQIRIAKLEAFMRPLLEMLGIVGIAVVTVWLGSQVINREVALEDFGALVFALGMLIDPLRKVADVYPRVMRSAAGARRIFSVIDAPEETELAQGAVKLPPLADAIKFDDVSFTYQGAPAPALRNVTVRIPKGQTVAIVGPNGSGKTTLTRMITRFYDPQSGSIRFDGVDIRQATLVSLRRQVSLVTQDPVVFAVTVAENIAYGSRNTGFQKIEQAAQKAHAHEFIKDLALGYDELLGERGGTLSGGQRQRICIARAVLRDAPILIFDEATSQIDTESEHKIQQTIRDISARRTTIIIAHRLSTIRFANRVIVMDAGTIIDTGTHEELIDRCDLYAALCRTQLGE